MGRAGSTSPPEGIPQGADSGAEAGATAIDMILDLADGTGRDTEAVFAGAHAAVAQALVARYGIARAAVLCDLMAARLRDLPGFLGAGRGAPH